jgi:carboxyl-terminal processing protease
VKLSLLLAVCVLFRSQVLAQLQPPRDFRNEAVRLKKVLDQYHYQPPALDDSFSNEVWQTVLNQLDPSHLYLNAADIQSLTQFRDRLDDEWNGDHWDFLQQLTNTYRNSLIRGGKYLSTEMVRDISWETAEVFVPQGQQVAWPMTVEEQKMRWRLWIKYKSLHAVQSLDSASAYVDIAFVRKHEKQVKQKILVVENRRARRILENPGGFENYVASVYFRTVTEYYDPHSLYLSPREFENFKAAVSNREYSFGVGLGEDREGNVIIEELLPGGPAWKSGEIHKGDVLIELMWEGQSKFDLSGIGLEEFLELLDRGNPSSVQLTVQHSNGLRQTILLAKERIQTEENAVKGFILKGARKVGYISLPGFYTKWGSDENSSCADDVAAELIKLKGENIAGLIFDIRSNGGGSLKEAIDMIGIFIDEGPLAIVKRKGEKSVTIKDTNRGTVYDGPVTVLIDGQSASASEVLAAALQDYHRGIILGGASFGKATGQIVIALDTANQPGTPDKIGPSHFGFATVTDFRIYRVTGKSNQGVGVIPDIRLPDLYAAQPFHEVSLPRAFKQDSLSKAPFFRALPAPPLSTLRSNSAERIKQRQVFKNIELTGEMLAEEKKESVKEVQLKWQDFTPGSHLAKSDAGLRDSPTSLYEVSFPEFSNIRVQTDAYLKTFTELWIKNLKDDPYVSEAFSITCDYIQLKSKK